MQGHGFEARFGGGEVPLGVALAALEHRLLDVADLLAVVPELDRRAAVGLGENDLEDAKE